MSLLYFTSLKEAKADELISDIKVNGVLCEEATIVQNDNRGRYSIPRDSLLKCNLSENVLDNDNFLDSSKIDSIYDDKAMIMEIFATTNNMFTTTINVGDIKISNSHTSYTATNRDYGAYINYNVTGSKFKDGNYIASTNEAVIFSEYGRLTNEFFVGEKSFNRNNKISAIRLNSNWTYDHQPTLSTLRVGDTVTSSSDFRGSTRIAGFQFSKDFSLDPNLITYPLLNFLGSSQVPTSIDVYANSINVFKNNLPSGNFELENIPISAGNGQVQINSTDITGKSVTYIVPFYTSPKLLKPELSDFSHEIGIKRKKFGINSNQYSDFISSGNHRVGIDNYLTSGVSYEYFKDIINLSSNNDLKLDQYGILSLGLNYNTYINTTSTRQNTASLHTGYNYQIKNTNFFIQNTTSSGKTKTAGSYPYEKPSSPTIKTGVNINLQQIGSVGLQYNKFADIFNNKSSIASLSYNNTLFNKIFIQGSIGKDFDSNSAFFGLTLSLHFGDNKTLSSGNNYANTRRNTYVEMASSMRDYEDFSYKVRLEDEIKQNHRVELDARSRFGKAKLLSFQNGAQKLKQLNLSGAFGYLDGSVFAMQENYKSFAVIRSNEDDLEIFKNNVRIGNVQKGRELVITGLSEYIKNDFSFNSKTLPISRSFEREKITVIPMRKSGSVIEFVTKPYRYLKINLVSNLNIPIEAGSIVEINNLNQTFLVGHNGNVFIDNLEEMPEISGKTCSANECCNFKIDTTGISAFNKSKKVICEYSSTSS